MSEIGQVVVVGAGPQALVAIDIFSWEPATRIVGLLDDAVDKRGTVVGGQEVLGTVDWGLDVLDPDIAFFVAIGGNGPRARVARRIREAGRRLANAVHPSAVLCSGVRAGSNVLVCANAVVGVETVLADDAVINTAATVDHESSVGAAAYLAPGVHTAGRVIVEEEAFIGAGSTIGPSVRIGAGSIVGAASLVLVDVPAGVVAWGRPARVVRAIEQPIDWSRVLGGAARG